MIREGLKIARELATAHELADAHRAAQRLDPPRPGGDADAGKGTGTVPPIIAPWQAVRPFYYYDPI